MNLEKLDTLAKTMSSLEIAKLTGKEHKNVIRDINVMLEELSKDGSNLSHEEYQILKDDRGYIKEINLNEEMSLTLVTGYSTVLRNKVVNRWHELEKVLSPGESIIAIGQNMVRLEHRTAKLAQEQKELDKRQNKVESEMRALSGQLEQMSIKAYCNLIGKPISNTDANKLGRAASQYSRVNGNKIGKVTDPIFGKINSYDQEVLENIVN